MALGLSLMVEWTACQFQSLRCMHARCSSGNANELWEYEALSDNQVMFIVLEIQEGRLLSQTMIDMEPFEPKKGNSPKGIAFIGDIWVEKVT